MARIIDKATLSPKTSLFIIDAPRIARKHLPGQFVIVRKDKMEERIAHKRCYEVGAGET